MKIFQKVHCKAYLEKYSDGVCLECRRDNVPAEGSSWKEPVIVKVYKFNNETIKSEIMEIKN